MNVTHILVGLLLPVTLMGQEQEGIAFEKELSWTEVQAKAKAENKYIFMDCVTTWCVPCKEMSKNVFTLKEAGAFFNERFISVQVQMDKTDKDPEAVRRWYDDAATIGKTHEVMAYPTLLYFTPEGELVHRVVGGKDLNGLLAVSSDALDPAKQYHTLIREFENAAEKTAEGYRRLSIAAKDVFDGKRSNAYAQKYLELAEDLFNRDGLVFAGNFTSSSSSPNFKLFLDEGERVDSVMGAGFAARILEPILLQEEVYPHVSTEEIPDWLELEAKVASKYPQLAPSVIARFKIQYYLRFKQWGHFEDAVTDYLAQYAHHAGAIDMNRFAMEFYRLGKDEQAIGMQQRAVTLAEGTMKDSFGSVLEKMRAGDRSWLK